MKIIHLKTFQEKAITDLRKQFLELWKTTNRKLPLIFKAPTGSGKTLMVAQFLKDISSDPQFDVDKAFLWFSFSEDSYVQSKKKLFNYYGGANELNLLERLYLGHNYLSTLPESLNNLESLKILNLIGNPLPRNHKVIKRLEEREVKVLI